MTSYTNTRIVESRTKLARRVSLGGLAVLAPGAILSFMGIGNPAMQSAEIIMVSYVSLILGTIATVIGGRLAEQWLIEPRDDQRLEKALKGLDRRYRLLNYHTPARHVLLAPGALYVAVVKDERGPIRFDGKRWSQPFSLGRLWREWRFGGLGVPTYEADNEIKKLDKWLRPKLGDTDVQILPLILFSEADAALDIAPGFDYIMPLKNLKPYLLRNKEAQFAPQTYQALSEVLVPKDESGAESPEDEPGEAAPVEPSRRAERRRKRRK